MSADLVAPLTTAEADHLAECEVVIERGMGVFIEVGTALMSVRDNRLYRAEHGTFEDYCHERWALSATHANRMIDSARVVETIITPIGAEIIPATESQARELAPLLDQPEELREVWNEAVERGNGAPTASVIRAVRQEREAPSTVEPERPRPPKWDPEERRQHELEVRRIQDIEAARRIAKTIVTEIQALVVTVVT